jgi:hypothetical protein
MNIIYMHHHCLPPIRNPTTINARNQSPPFQSQPSNTTHLHFPPQPSQSPVPKLLRQPPIRGLQIPNTPLQALHQSLDLGPLLQDRLIQRCVLGLRRLQPGVQL